jgi:predicted glycoside hydrolase/deacetylase ChbG (UPF0249 family)
MGYRSGDRLLIVNADDYGMCQTFNTAAQQLLLRQAISSATLMVPCPWAKGAADFCKEHPEVDVGIHLTFTSEWTHYKWGPVTRANPMDSLRTVEGWFHADNAGFQKNADAAEVRQEIFSQIERAIAWGVDPTHLDVHMYSLLGLATGRDFLEPVFEACGRYGLPLRLPRSWATRPGFSDVQTKLMRRRIDMAEERGIALVDEHLGLDFFYTDGETYEQAVNQMSAILRSLKPGISEILVHAGHVTDELRSIMPHDFPKRDMEARLFLDDRIQQLLAAEGIRLIRWRELRDYQRKRADHRIPAAPIAGLVPGH